MNNRLRTFFVLTCVGLLCLVQTSACTSSSGIGSQERGITPDLAGTQQHVPLIQGTQALDLASYTKIPLTESQLEVSSILTPSFSGANLVRHPSEDWFWHVETPKKETRSWVLVDMKTEQSVAVLGVRGRSNTEQMWLGHQAVLEASEDAQNWIILARLGLDEEAPNDEWAYFTLSDPEPYRYYRLSIHDWDFISMAGLAMYAPAGALVTMSPTNPRPFQAQATREFTLFFSYTNIPLEGSQLEVSSSMNPTNGKDNLIQPGDVGFWHVKQPREEEREWVFIDLKNAQAVSLLRVKPRTDAPITTMWRGYTADFEASDDGQDWTTLAVLGVKQSDLTGDWLHFLVGNLQPYRYYRLSVWDKYFMSLSRLQLYGFREGLLE